MKIKNPIYKSGLVLSILSIIITLFLYSKLPNEVPIHFNFAGEIDNYGPRSFMLLTACLPLISLMFFKLIPKLDPKGSNYKFHMRAYNIFILFIILFFLALHWITMSIALGIPLSINKVVPTGVGILFLVIGNYMPQIRQNYTYGIKLPWTLADEDNWRATHRIGGYCYLITGILFILSACVPVSFVQICTILALIFILIPMVYSYIYFKKHQTVKR